MRARRGPRIKRDIDLTNGPGKLCQALGITNAQNLHPLQKPPLLIRRGTEVPREAVTRTPRIGISQSADWPLRWVVTDSPFASKTPRGFPRFTTDR
jgi:DNA-3-methyladenine glycosylase